VALTFKRQDRDEDEGVWFIVRQEVRPFQIEKD
jgi:hypothetical protein